MLNGVFERNVQPDCNGKTFEVICYDAYIHLNLIPYK